MESKSESSLEINNLVYKQPTALSLATTRTLCRQFFQRSNYKANETAICEWNTGSAYVNTHNSYLTFNAKVTGYALADGITLGSGSGLNFIRALTLRTRTGVEVARLEQLNLYQKFNVQYTLPEDYIEHQGGIIGFSQSGTPETFDTTTLDSAVRKFCIPLNHLCGFFAQDQLLPATVASGLRLTIEWEDHRGALFLPLPAEATQFDGDGGYEISDISVMTDCVHLSDSTQRTLNMEAANSGLESTFKRVFTTQQSAPATDNNVQVRKAVSQASRVFAMVRDPAHKLTTEFDSFASVPWDVTAWQYRLGSIYMPNQEIRDPQAVESFLIANQAFDKCNGTTKMYCDNAVDLSEFKAGYGVMAQSLERDQDLNLSGLPINNSRVLELNFSTATAAEREVIVFLEYDAVLRSFIDNVSLSI